jgi:hypothetical protein
LGKHEEKLTKYMGYKCRIPFRSTWVYPRVLVGFMLLDL